MCEIKSVHGVLDRLADRNQAVILIEELNKEIIIPTIKLPEASQANTWFTIKLRGDEIIEIEQNDEKTDQALQKSTDLMEKLRSKSKGSKFKRK